MTINVNNAVKVQVSSGYVDVAVSLASLNLADALNGALKGETKFLARSNDTLRQLTELKRLSDKLSGTLKSDKANESYTRLGTSLIEPKEFRRDKYVLGNQTIYSPPSEIPKNTSVWIELHRDDGGGSRGEGGGADSGYWQHNNWSKTTEYHTPRTKYDDAKAELATAAAKMGFGVQVNTFNEVQTLLRSIDGYLNLQNNEQSASMTRIQGQKDGVNTSIQQTAKNYSESNAAARKLI